MGILLGCMYVVSVCIGAPMRFCTNYNSIFGKIHHLK